jgi:hypothetical protein
VAKILPFSISKKASMFRQRAQHHHAIAKAATGTEQRQRNELIAAAYLSLAQNEEWLAGARVAVHSAGEVLPSVDFA